ncbi:putative 3-alpha-(S)-strictosidine beta-glucosidase [Helianthus annuus]|nr:putative 3-alpha-(S)-strictosidine beta-glucosidase [Helianthus annuus]
MAEEKISVYPDYDHDPNIKRHDFPSDFMFGVGTSSYQIEGAWNADGKGLSIWDCHALRHPENIVDGSNACVTIDSYHRMKEDVQLLKKMGVKYYRFSISWSRILPGGKVSMGKNLEGINYYNKLIDELKANDVEPFVTLYHWDLPNALEEEYMGFLSSKIVDDFVNYAEICFWEFGDRVKNWVTINEPYRIIYGGYVKGNYAPGRGGKNQDGDRETEPYIVAYNLLNCHAAAYRKYEEDFKDAQKGKVGISLDTSFFKPFRGNGNKDDVKAVEYAYDFMLGWFMEPLTCGNWPKNIQKFATTPSRHHPQGRYLPVFTDDQKNKLIQSYDFLGLNYYTADYAQIHNSSSLSEGFLDDCHYKASGTDPNGNDIGEAAFKGSWVYLCANELFLLLEHIKNTYKLEKHIIVTENGAPQQNDNQKTNYEQARDDAFRLKYIKWHLEAIRRANNTSRLLTSERTKPLVMGYFVWSFTDSFEWGSGYTLRFGMNYVDFKNNLHRYPKKSALWFKKFLSENKWNEPRKRSLINVEQEDEDVNGALVKPEQEIEVVQKLKKAKT